MKHKLLFFIAFLWSAWSFGQGFNYKGINYEVTSDVAPLTVSVSNNGNFRGNAVIPGMVSYNGASYNVTSIGDSSFANCSSLTSVTIPYSVTSIGRGSFAYCTSLTSVSIPSSVTSINGFAFVNCSSLTSVAIPNSVTLIGEGVFAACSSLKTVTIPDSVASIGDNFFNGCSSLTSVTIPSSVALIGNNAFDNCSNLTKVTIPDSVTSIGEKAFNSCSSLISITIPASVTFIGKEAFNSCYNLKQITCNIEEPLSIDSSVFNRVDLESCRLIVPTGQTQAYKDTEVWSYFTTLTDVAPFVVDGITYEITSAVEPTTVKVIENLENSNASSITIPATVSNNGVVYNVTEISSSALKGYNNLKQITCGIEEPLVLDESVFDDLDLESCRLIVPTGKVQAYSEAFVWGYFTTITDTAPFVVNDVAYEIISESTVKVVMNAEGTNVSSITIPTTVSYNGVVYNITEITDSAFGGYNNLKQITCDFEEPLTINEPIIYNVNLEFCRLIVPTGKVQVYSDADVWGYFGTITDVAPFIVDGIAYEITSATEPTTVKVIFNPENNYSGSITIPSTVSNAGVVYNVTEISDNAFQYNTDITSVSIGDNVTSIENGTFQGCDMLISANIGDSVTSIGSSAFSQCDSLVSVTIGDSVTSIGSYAFSDCDSLVSVTIGDSVTSIGDYAFNGCSGLVSVAIPDSVTSIGWAAFSRSGLASVTIPDSVTSIGGYAFSSCQSLTSVTIGDSVTSIGEGVFQNCPKLKLVNCAIESPLGINSNVFSSNTPIGNCKLVVPTASLEAYRAAAVWKNFYSITDMAIFVVDGISYEKNSASTVKVIPSIDKAYTGSVTIPTSVSYNGESYSVTVIGADAFVNSDWLSEITIGSEVTTIEDRAFLDTKLASVIIPDSVTSIGESAFQSIWDLTSITIGKNVNTIGANAFANCDTLVLVTCLNSTVIEVPNVFDGVNQSNCSLKVPEASLEAYQAAAVWKDFSPITAITTLGTVDFSAKNKISLYPNPVHDELFVQLNTTDKTTIQLFDATGKVLIQKTVNAAENSIDTSNLVNGLYFVKVNSNEGTITKKVIKN
jgi:hypothetical protein